jgi:hypothetical protein
MTSIDAEQLKSVLRGLQAERQAGKRRETPIAFRKAIDRRQEAIRLLSNIGTPFTPARVIIDTPLLIWVQHNLPETANILVDSNIEPNGSWAKTYSALESDGDVFAANDDLNFYFIWQNSTGQDAVINVNSFLMLDGLCNAWGHNEWVSNPWGWQAFGHAEVAITAQLSLLEWWNQPPTTPLKQPGQRQEVLNLAHNGHWAGGGPSIGTDENVSNNYHLTYDTFGIPADKVAVFEVGLKIVLYGWDGRCSADFSTDPFTIVCPRLELEILTAPQSSYGSLA